MKFHFISFLVFFFFTACSPTEDFEPTIPGAPTEVRGPFLRTVLFYISGENNLSPFIEKELKEIRKGSIAIGNNAVVVYVDDSNAERPPYILWIREGETIDSMQLKTDPISSRSEVMRFVLNHTSTYYPADEYGIVLWGHATGWLINDTVEVEPVMQKQARRAYGVDNGKNNLTNQGEWMTISTLAKTLWEWKHLKFIFADCCQFQCVESIYELRNVADYIIGSPAEIPGDGAPYDTLLRSLFDTSNLFYRSTVDAYYNQVFKISYFNLTYNSRTPLSVVKTSELHNLADATHDILQKILPGNEIDLLKKNLIYYRGNYSKPNETVMYDMNDFIKAYASEADYKKWKTIFDQAVIYKRNAKEGWMTAKQIHPNVFTSGILTDERYGGLSMFIHQDRASTKYMPYYESGLHYKGYNLDIQKTDWYAAACLHEFGW